MRLTLRQENDKLARENAKLKNRLKRPANQLKEGMHIRGYLELKEQYDDAQRIIERYQKAMQYIEHGVRCPQCTCLLKIHV